MPYLLIKTSSPFSDQEILTYIRKCLDPPLPEPYYANVQFVPIYFSSAGGVNASAGVLLQTPFGLTFDFVYHGNTLSKLHRVHRPWRLLRGGWESLNVQPSCCLDVEVCMLNCVFWRHIRLEIEFKSRIDMGSDNNRYTAQRYHPWAVARISTREKKQKRGEFKTPPYPTGRRSKNWKTNLD